MSLFDLQHSAFLQSLGWAIANSLWQGAVLWSLYLLVNISYKNASSTFKTNCGTASLFLLFGWFLVTFFQKFFLALDQSDVTGAAGSSLTMHLPGSASFFNWHKIVDAVINTLPYLSVAYLFLLVVLTLRLINSYRHIYFIKQNGLHKAGVEWRLFAEKVATRIGITKKITLWLSDHVDVPATIGFIKPVILIPIASMNQLSVDQLEAIILHELSHIKRNDYLINLFISLIETILFFNPFVVLLSNIIKKERENSCDDFVIQYQYDRHSYASALLSLEQSRNQHLRLALTATSGKKQLLRRIQRIMEVNNGDPGFNYGQKLLALILVTGIICSVAWLSPEKKENTQRNFQTANNINGGKVINIDKIRHDVTAHAYIGLKNISATPKSRKSTHVTDNEDAIENPDDNNVQDDLPSLTGEGMQSAVTQPQTNSNGFFYTDKSQHFAAPEHPMLFKNKKFFITRKHLFTNTQLFDEATIRIDLEKLKSEIENANLSFNWKKVEDDIKQNWENIQWLVPDQTEQKKIEEKIEKLVEKETQKSTENAKERIRKSQRINRQDLLKLNRIALMRDSAYTSAIGMVNKCTAGNDYTPPPRGEYFYMPPVPAVPSKKRTPKLEQHFEYQIRINTDPSCIQLKIKN